MKRPLPRTFPVGGPDGMVPEVYLGDRFWADYILKPDATTYARITRLLGLAPSTEAEGSPVEVEPTASPTMDTLLSSGLSGHVTADVLGVGSDLSTTPAYRQSSIEWTAHQPIVIPQVDDALTLPSEAEVPFGVPPIAPLFEPRWTRGILIAALATNSGDGPVDVIGLVNLLAAGEAIQDVPRLPMPTLRRGVQLLLDLSESMLPYSADIEVLQGNIRDIVGRERLQILRFSGDLLRSGTGPRHRPQPYALPRPGTVIVLLTDLAIGRSWLDSDWVGAERWAALADLARQAQCPLVAFVPYGEMRWPRTVAERWPSNLERRMTVIRWDRPTTAGAVRRLVGIAHEVQS